MKVGRKMSVQEINNILNSEKTDSSRLIIERLLSLGATMTSEQGEKLIDDHPELVAISSIATKHYNNYILQSEDGQSKDLLSDVQVKCFEFGRTANQFGNQAYTRVNDIFKYVDFSSCKNFTMVGCGALPVTMFQVFENTEVPEIISMDIREEAIQTVRHIVEKYQMSRIKPLLESGDIYDYSNSDVIYVANMVSPKKEVLDRIIKTAKPTAQIVVRDPYSIGRLWTERGVDKLDNRYEIIEYGEPSSAYFSQDIFLRLNI